MADEYRDSKELDHCLAETDQKIAELIKERARISEELTRRKIADGDRIFDKARDLDLTERMAAQGDSEFTSHALEQLFTQITAMSRERQYQLLTESGVQGRLPFFMVDEIEKKDVRVVYQGVEGAYSHAAMCTYFGEDVSCFHVKTWRDAMESIANGEADYAVLPIENSTAGIVADNFDLLVDFENYIVAEQDIKCEHVLMGLPGTKLEELETVYSHQQALMQCAPFLDSHRNWTRIPYANTAMAAKKVAKEGIRSHAAIGSAFAARRFGLEVLAEHIYSNEANTTRFIIVTNQRVFSKSAEKISICFELPHRSGALFNIIAHFIYNNLNMNRIESRPLPGRNWEYRFFIDFEGNLSQSSVKNALRGIRAEAINMKILGNY